MPFDYDSFMTGVITGFKLGRVPKGRKPPVPSGRYILTESGERVITEKTIDWDGITIFETDVWYALEHPFASSGYTYTKVRFRTNILYQEGEPSIPIKSYVFYRELQSTETSRYTLGSVTFSYGLGLPETSWQAPGSAYVAHIVDFADDDGHERIQYAYDWAYYYYGFEDVDYWPKNGIPSYNTQDPDYFVGSYSNGSVRLWFPAGIEKTFNGTTEDLYNLFANRKFFPMITEGG